MTDFSRKTNPVSDHKALCFQNAPSSRIWTSDLRIPTMTNYSPPLYQLSYLKGCCLLTRYPCSIVAHCLCESPSWSLSHTEIADRGNGPSDKKTTAILFVWERLAVFIFAAHNVKVIQCHSIEGRPTDGFGCLTVCKRASSHNYFEFWYLVWHTISLYEWPFENIWQLPHPFIFSHLIITCLLFLFVFWE